MRSIVLTGSTVEDRSRELAAALAFIVEQHPKPSVAPRPEPSPVPSTPPAPAGRVEPRPRTRGWLALGARVGLGAPSDPDLDGGLALRGGLWLVRHDIVQPIVEVDWSRSATDVLALDGIRFGGGLAIGRTMGGALWLGIGAIQRALWAQATERRRSTRWLSSTELTGLLQVRLGPWLLLGLRTGAELTFPPIQATGQGPDSLRWGRARWLAGAELGFVIPPGARLASPR
jgi:hypothetical protein